jgi:hypothetical protein
MDEIILKIESITPDNLDIWHLKDLLDAATNIILPEPS